MTALAGAAGWAVVHLWWQGLLVGAFWWVATRGALAAARYAIGLAALGGLACMFVMSVIVFLLGTAPDLASRVTIVTGTMTASSDVALIVARVAMVTGVFWVLGALILALRHAGGWRLAREVCVGSSTVAARADWQACAREAADGLEIGVLPQIVESNCIDSPAVFGVRHPVVVLPARALDRLTHQQLRGVLAHELAHVRRRDSIVNLAQCVIDVVLFFHPVTYIISRSVRAEREKICDVRAARVCGDAAEYVAGLVTLEESRFRFGRFALAARSANGPLLERARYVLERTHAPASYRRIALTAACGAVGTAAVIVMAAPTTAHAGAIRLMPPEFTVAAVDPAGPFTLTVRHGRAVASTVDGAAVAGERITQQRDSVFVLRADGSRELGLQITPRGGIAWLPRAPITP